MCTNQECTGGTPQYIIPIFVHFAGIAVFLLNKRLGVFHNPTQDLVELQKKASDFIKGTSYMGKGLGLHKFIPTPGRMKFLKSVEYLDSWSEQCISTAKDRIAASGSNSDITFGFLDQWLLEGKLTNAEIVALLRDFFAGGIDTVSADTCIFPNHYEDHHRTGLT